MFLDHLYGSLSGESRTITPENPDGSPGGACRSHPNAPNPLSARSARAARDLGVGWKVSPCVDIPPGATWNLADIAGPGVIRHIWLTLNPAHLREVRFTAAFDGAPASVDAPIGDFFCTAWRPIPIGSIAMTVGTNGGLNCFLPMPFDTNAHLMVENRGDHVVTIYYAIDYELSDQRPDTKRLHARFSASAPVGDDGIHSVLERPDVDGRYVGTFMTWEQATDGWWGEGEMKFFMNGDTQFPTITSTGLEDYFGGAWNFAGGSFSTPHLGFVTVEGQNERAGARHAMYRFHMLDPIVFRGGLRVNVQALGWNDDWTYRILNDRVSSVAYWYE